MPSNVKRSSFEKKETNDYLVLPPFPCGIKKAAALFEQWVKDQVIRLPFLDHSPSAVDQKLRTNGLTIEEEAPCQEMHNFL